MNIVLNGRERRYLRRKLESMPDDIAELELIADIIAECFYGLFFTDVQCRAAKPLKEAVSYITALAAKERESRKTVKTFTYEDVNEHQAVLYCQCGNAIVIGEYGGMDFGPLKCNICHAEYIHESEKKKEEK